MTRWRCSGALLAALSMPLPAQPVADYLFNGTLDDSLGIAPPLTALVPEDGSYVTETLGGVADTGRTFSEGTGFELPVAGLLANDEYTIAIVFEFDDTAAWAKIIDAVARASDTGLYANANRLTLYPTDETSADLFDANTYRQVVVTRDAAGSYVCYVDGVVQFTYDDSATGYGRISSENLLAFLRDDEMTLNNENSAGTVLRIRLFDTALDAAAVLALENDRAGDIVFADGFDGAP